jgi:hypothetical protein
MHLELASTKFFLQVFRLTRALLLLLLLLLLLFLFLDFEVTTLGCS